jgi:hypothetical protein
MQRLTHTGEITDLVKQILLPSRKLPIVVVTGNLIDHGSLVDLEELTQEVGTLCEIVFIASADLTRELAALLPDNTGVFGGALRIYRSDFHEDPAPKRSKLFNFKDTAHAKARMPKILEEIWAAAHAAGGLKKIEQRAVSAKAKVKMFMGDSRVFVELDSGKLATIQQEMVMPDVPLEWAFSMGQELQGVYDDELRIFIPNQVASSPEDLASHFGLNNVTLGLVKAADRQNATIAVLPNLLFEVPKADITGNPLDVISSYLDIGDVVSVRIYRHPEGKIRLRMNDIDDDEEVLEALAILPGGKPWLLEGRDVPWQTSEPETQEIAIIVEEFIQEITELPVAPIARPIPTPGLQQAFTPPGAAPTKTKPGDTQSLKVMGETIRRQQAQNERLIAERVFAHAEYAQEKFRREELVRDFNKLKLEMAELRKAKRAQQSNKSSTFSRRNRFASDSEWLHEELRRAWIGRYTAQERSDSYRLRPEKFSFSARFCESVREPRLDEDEIRKVVRLMVDIVTGRNAAERKHTVHELFDGLGGAQRSRADGALCWRVHIENGSPQAKRLHYWEKRDGVIEFGWVANHDDDL